MVTDNATEALRARLHRACVGALCCALLTGCASTGAVAPKPQPDPMAALDTPAWLVDLAPVERLTGDALKAAREGRSALAQGAAGPAAVAFRNAIALAPEALGLHTELAMALRLSGQHRLALEHLRQPLTGSSNASVTVRAQLVRLNVLIASGDLATAWSEARSLAQRQPLLLDAHYALGRALLAVGKRLEAQRAFDEVRLHAPNHQGAALGALAAMSASPESVDYKTLKAQLQRRWPNNPDLHVIAGTAQEIAGNKDLAMASYRKALTLDERHATANFNLARLIEERQGLPAARPFYQRFLESAAGARSTQVKRLRKRLGAAPE